jgi:lipopolysaccharide export system permease protein
MLSPLINFIAVIFFTAKMADQTEIVPILSGGVSFNRYLRPYWISAFVIFLVSLIANLYIIPSTNKLKNDFENVYVNPKVDNAKLNIHMQMDKNTYVSINNFDNNQKIGFKFTLEKFKGFELREKLVADRITWDSVKRVWTLDNYSIRSVDGLKEKMTYGVKKDTTLDMRPSDFEIYENIFDNMSMRTLNDRIKKEEIRGTGIMTDLLLQKYKRFINPVAIFILTLIGVSLSSRKVRGGVGLPLGIGIFLSFAYIVCNQFSTMFALKGGLPPLLAVLLPNVLFGLLGLYLMAKAPK